MERAHLIDPHRRRIAHAAWPFAACGIALWAFTAIGDNYLGSYALDLGSLTVPNARHTYFLFWWMLLGSAAAGFAILGVTRVMALFAQSGGPPRSDPQARDWTWVALVSASVFLSAVAIRAFVLRGAPVTDDESGYKFMAEVLATGRLWVDSPPLKAFFDRVFMINDGRFYGQYFIGWSALMVPGVYVGATGYMNALYAALTVPALFGTVRRLAGPSAARVTTLIFLASPMLMVGAATEMSHPSCLMALAWTFYFHLRSCERPDAWWTHAGVAFFFGLAFLIRPTSAVGVGLPVLLAWLWTTARSPAAVRRVAFLAFALPATALAAVFLGVNTAQNGSPLLTSYARMQDYMKEVNYQNVGWSVAPPTRLRDYILPNANIARALATTSVGLVRLVFDLFALPLSGVLVAFAWARPRAWLPWLSVLTHLGVHFFMGDPGVDTFGPVHFYELSLPLLLLCGVGFDHFATALRTWRPAMPPLWPLAIVASVVLVALVGFAPVRLDGVRRVASSVNMPADAVRDAKISNAVIFTAGLFVPQSCSFPTRHFVHFRPNNDPAMKNDILWVNHLGWDVDHDLMKYFPGRVGYLMEWKNCRPHFIRL
jgi:hypothetical protein